MLPIYKSKYLIPAVHISIWLLLLGTAAFVFRTPPSDDTGLSGSFFLITNIYHIGLFYLNGYYLFPRFFNRKTWWLYILFIPAILAISYFGKIYFLQLFNASFALNDINHRIIFFPPVPFLVISIIFRVIINRAEREKNEKARKAEQLSSELKFLRLQVSPHFLFNMMTNMVSLARQKSDLLEPSLIRLSDLLRYMLYDAAKDKFLLSRELLYLENYIELQKLRFGDEVNIEFVHSDLMQDYLVEPMLLIPFVENAFKHGIGLVEKPFIGIKLEVNNNQLAFSVINNYNPQNLSKDKESGIGLANVKERLKLLYPGKHKLVIRDENAVYEIKLNIELS